jgi:hypothetical protein
MHLTTAKLEDLAEIVLWPSISFFVQLVKLSFNFLFTTVAAEGFSHEFQGMLLVRLRFGKVP